ncbi:MAG: hypothetical protein HOF66_04935 [Nitrosomonadaceae bacterium]|nr:hypothetical protein [Nitrosomonadaceae bacterium]
MPSLLRKQNVIWKLSVTVYAAALFAISSSAIAFSHDAIQLLSIQFYS